MHEVDLRPVAPNDASALWDLLKDPEVARWLRPAGASGPFSVTECEASVAQKLAHWRAHGFGMFLAWQADRCTGRSIVQHNLVAGRSEVEIGWTAARGCWGQGIATELGRHALATARSIGFRRVVAFTRTDNVASRRIMDKLKLRYEHDFDHAGLPHVLYSTDT